MLQGLCVNRAAAQADGVRLFTQCSGIFLNHVCHWQKTIASPEIDICIKYEWGLYL